MAFSLAYDLPLTFWFLPLPAQDRGDITFSLTTVTQLDDATLVGLVFDTSPAVEERLAALGADPNLSSRDQQKMRALLRQQEGQLQSLLEAVRSAQEGLDRKADSVAKRPRSKGGKK